MSAVFGGKICSNEIIAAQKHSGLFYTSLCEYRHDLSLEDFFLLFGVKLSGDNRWIKLAELIS
jgi:hypothetical protein